MSGSYDRLMDELRAMWDEADGKQLRQEAAELGECPNGPDEDGIFPCDPKGYFGIAECQVCGRIGTWPGAKLP